MTELRQPGEDFAAWTASRWGEIVPDTDSAAATVSLGFMRVAAALEQSHARVIRRWKNRGVNTIVDFRTLGLLRHVGEDGIRPQHIAEQLGADPGSVSSRVARLERHGLVERFDDPADGRARRVRLRGEHQTLVDEMYRALVEDHQRFFAKLSTEQHQELSTLLGLL